MSNFKLKSKNNTYSKSPNKTTPKNKNLTLEVESERRMETDHDGLDLQQATAHSGWDSPTSSTVQGVLGGGVG